MCGSCPQLWRTSNTLCLDTRDTSWICHSLLSGLLCLVGLEHSHRLIHLQRLSRWMLATPQHHGGISKVLCFHKIHLSVVWKWLPTSEDCTKTHPLVEHLYQEQRVLSASLCHFNIKSRWTQRNNHRDVVNINELKYLPLSGETLGTPACGAALSCQFPATCQWSSLPGLGAWPGSVGTDAHLQEWQIQRI